MTTSPDWAEALRLAQPVLDAPHTTYSVLSRGLAEWVRDNAPKPTVRERILALPVGSVWVMKDTEMGRPLTYVKVSTDLVRDITNGSSGVTLTLLHKDVFTTWSDGTRWTDIYVPEVSS